MVTIAKAKENEQTVKPRNKGGAPKKKIRRELIIRIRMTATERFQIDTKAKAAGMRSSSWIRAAAKSAKVVPRLTVEERRIIWSLAELANNLNQLTKLAHQKGLLTVARECGKIIKEIETLFKKVNNNDRESDNP
jgi:hypothetical protein